MSAQDIELWLVVAAAPPATLAPILYAFLAPWWRTVVGRAFMVAKVALASLIDLSLAAYYFHVTPPSWLVITIYSLIAAGAWLWLGALIDQQIQKRRKR